MTDLRALVAAIERQKPEIMGKWRTNRPGPPLWVEIGPPRSDSPQLTIDEASPLLLGLLMEWAITNNVGCVMPFRVGGANLCVGVRDWGHAHVEEDRRGFDDLLAAWAWVCGIELEDA